MKKLIKRLVCDWFHVGGIIERDHEGRINWRCLKCGRWGDNPVSKETERHVFDSAMQPNQVMADLIFGYRSEEKYSCKRSTPTPTTSHFPET